MYEVPPGPYQPPSPADGVALAQGRRVSTGGYWIAGLVLVAGVAAAVIWFVVSIVSLLNVADGFDRIGVPGRAVLELDSGEWIVYHEYRGAGSGTYRLEPEVAVTDPDGRAVPVDYVSSVSETYVTAGGNEGVSIARFVAAIAGRYEIEVLGEPAASQRIAVGRSIQDSVDLGGILGSIAVGMTAAIAALVIFLITLTRRGRARRAAPSAPAAGWSGTPTGEPTPPGPPPSTAPSSSTGPSLGPPPSSGDDPPVRAPWSSPQPPPGRTPPPPGASPWAPPGDDRPRGT